MKSHMFSRFSASINSVSFYEDSRAGKGMQTSTCLYTERDLSSGHHCHDSRSQIEDLFLSLKFCNK